LNKPTIQTTNTASTFNYTPSGLTTNKGLKSPNNENVNSNLPLSQP